MTHSSAHANRNAGSGPNDSRTNTYTPPERGNAAASSEYVSAPHSTTTPPTIQARRKSGTSSMRCATPAGVRKMPLPIVEPTSTATALHRPSRRESRSPQRSAGAGGDIGVDNIRQRAGHAALGARLKPRLGVSPLKRVFARRAGLPRLKPRLGRAASSLAHRSRGFTRAYTFRHHVSQLHPPRLDRRRLHVP